MQRLAVGLGATEIRASAMTPANKTARILRATGPDREEELLDAVAFEAPLEILLVYPDARTGRTIEAPLSVTMRTPGADEALVTGLLFCEGLIPDAHWIKRFDSAGSQIAVHLKQKPLERPDQRQRRFLSSSSCGVCGKTELGALARTAIPDFSPTAPLLQVSVLRKLPERLRQLQEAFDSTGGMHAAARFTMSGTCRGICEDVGRHNALDKLIGDALVRQELPARDEVLLVSGRVSYELVQKSLAAAFPILAAIGAPSSLAVEMCNAARQTLVGFLRTDRHNLYSHPQRIVST